MERLLEKLIVKCCSFDAEERPSFTIISEELLKETMNMNDIDEEGKNKINQFLIYCGRKINKIKESSLEDNVLPL